MKSSPKIGTAGELKFIVEQKHVIDFATDGMPAVLSTPNLIGLLERTARQTLAPFLESDERSVGMEIEIRHLAATPLGQQVTCSARVISVDGRQIGFQIEARDEHELIVKGLHKRSVIRVGAFASRLERKTAKRL
ncbi:MAG TPA: thioesterase family protein [Candidatus Paceibacterota bacterium]|nr:thioesterase family protein [Candidatus Paceibacterota bacterium]